MTDSSTVKRTPQLLHSNVHLAEVFDRYIGSLTFYLPRLNSPEFNYLIAKNQVPAVSYICEIDTYSLSCETWLDIRFGHPNPHTTHNAVLWWWDSSSSWFEGQFSPRISRAQLKRQTSCAYLSSKALQKRWSIKNKKETDELLMCTSLNNLLRRRQLLCNALRHVNLLNKGCSI